MLELLNRTPPVNWLLLKSLTSIIHNSYIWIHNNDLEQASTLFESSGAHVFAINNFKVGYAIHFHMLANHISSWIYIPIFRVQKTLKEDMVPIQCDHRYYSWSDEVLNKEMKELLTNGKVLMECLLQNPKSLQDDCFQNLWNVHNYQ
jgi:hypothetical protein